MKKFWNLYDVEIVFKEKKINRNFISYNMPEKVGCYSWYQSKLCKKPSDGLRKIESWDLGSFIYRIANGFHDKMSRWLEISLTSSSRSLGQPD